MTNRDISEPTPEPMTPERIADLRAVAESFWSQTTDSALASQCDATIQCLDEIERLRAGLQTMHDDPLSTRYTLRHQAWQLLSGYAIEAIGGGK